MRFLVEKIGFLGQKKCSCTSLGALYSGEFFWLDFFEFFDFSKKKHKKKKHRRLCFFSTEFIFQNVLKPNNEPLAGNHFLWTEHASVGQKQSFIVILGSNRAKKLPESSLKSIKIWKSDRVSWILNISHQNFIRYQLKYFQLNSRRVLGSIRALFDPYLACNSFKFYQNGNLRQSEVDDNLFLTDWYEDIDIFWVSCRF